MAEEQGFKSLKFYNRKNKEIISMMFIWQEWTTNKKINKSKKTKTSIANKIKTTQKIFMTRISIMTMILIKKNWMGY